MVLNATDPKRLADKLTVEALEGDWYITDRQPMTKEDYISIIAFATGDPIQILNSIEWKLLPAKTQNRPHLTVQTVLFLSVEYFTGVQNVFGV